MNYQLLANGYVKRLDDGATIPDDSRNMDYVEFLQWCAKGNTPLAAEVAPEVAPVKALTLDDIIAVLTPDQQAALDAKRGK